MTNVCGNNDEDDVAASDAGCNGADGEDVCCLKKLALLFLVLLGIEERENEALLPS